jgi:2-hydroxy-3-keto-5-methylthiopentenyl-1-phosphate phosphatase
MRNIHFFLDFDGTISSGDVVDLVLERFADPSWKEIEEEWARGKIGSRECLSRQMALVRATPDELRETVSHIGLDPHFLDFVKKADDYGVALTIVSDGFDLLIEQVLRQNLEGKTGLIKGIPVHSNRLKATAKGFEAVFPSPECAHGCANCKQVLVKNLSSVDDNVFFVGDGLSDRYAARVVHLTFAKGKLLDYCKEKDIECIAYQDFGKVAQWLEDNHSFLRKVRVSDAQR